MQVILPKTARERVGRRAYSRLRLWYDEQALFEGGGDGGRAVADAQFGVRVQEVGFDRRLADVEQRGRLPVAVAPGDQREHLDLAGAERLLDRRAQRPH